MRKDRHTTSRHGYDSAIASLTEARGFANQINVHEKPLQMIHFGFQCGFSDRIAGGGNAKEMVGKAPGGIIIAIRDSERLHAARPT